MCGCRLNRLQKKILQLLNDELELTPRPFDRYASILKIKPAIFIKNIRELVKKGYIRRIGFVIQHQKSGYKYNAMLVFRISQKNIDKTGKILSKYHFVTHCYQRRTTKDWPYNLYAMLHSRTKKGFREMVDMILKKISYEEYKLLVTKKDLKIL
ncbi:MAG: hypothetical protein AB1765_05440 [Candidatus Hydrogenedentota bacterium]